MSTIGSTSSNPLPLDPTQIAGQHGHGGGHKGAVHNTPNQQNIVQQQQQAGSIVQYEELQEIHHNVTEETQPEKDREQQDQDPQSKKEKLPSPKTQWRRARNARLKI